MKQITVLLADDHQVVREGFRSLLEHERDIKVVGEAETGRQAVELTRKLHPAVVVMDIAMPLLNGLEATRQIRKSVPDTKVLILSAHSDDAYVEQVAVLGAAGFLLKQTSSHVLATAIRDAGHKNVHYFRSMQAGIEFLLHEARPGDAIMTIGAGNVSRASNELMVLLGTEHPTHHAR